MDLGVLDEYATKQAFVEEVKKMTFDTEVRCHGCGQVIVHTFLKTLRIDNPELSMAASPFFAGVALTGNMCGALVGGLMVLGLFFGRKDVDDEMPGLLKEVKPLRKLVKVFIEKNKNLDCRNITGTDLANPVNAAAYFGTGGLERCAGIMSETSGHVAEVIYDHYRLLKAATDQ